MMPTTADMPPSQPNDQPPVPKDGNAAVAAWFLRFFSNMTADRLLVLVLLCGISWFGWNGEEKAQRRESRDDETMRDYRREAESREEKHRKESEVREEKYRQHNLDTIKICNQSCEDREKRYRAESAAHMKEAMAVMSGIKDELMKLNRKMGGPPPSVIP